MFFRVIDKHGDVGYVNLSLVEFARPKTDGSIELYSIGSKSPLTISPESAKDMLKYLQGYSNNAN